ncbi:MAG: ABC transporter permease [Clostridia bacterium]|nr:ABC transporter permease [Clostridia bacterium]
MEKTKKLFSANIREISLVIVIILISAFVQVRSGGGFLTGENITDMLLETSVLAITAVGMMMVILTGGIDLSIGAVMALGAMAGTTVLKNSVLSENPVSNIWIVLIAVGVGLICGLINGLLISKLKILPIIATLGMMNIYRGITYLIANGSWVKQAEMGPKFLSLATGKTLGIYNLLLIAIIVYLVAFFFSEYTKTGRKIYAVGNSEESARVSGIKTDRIITLAYVILGGIAGLGGILYVCKYGVAQGETGTGYEMNVIAACVLGGVSISGGKGKVAGVLLGAILLGMLNNAMPLIQVSSFWQEAIRGGIILVSIVINALIARNVEKKDLRRRSI